MSHVTVKTSDKKCVILNTMHSEFMNSNMCNLFE